MLAFGLAASVKNVKSDSMWRYNKYHPMAEHESHLCFSARRILTGYPHTPNFNVDYTCFYPADFDRDGSFFISAKNTPIYSLSTLKLGVRGQGAEANKSRTHPFAALPSLRMVFFLYRHGTPSQPNFPTLKAQTVRGRTQSVVVWGVSL